MEESIKRKLQGLFAKTLENGCTEDEQASAMALAAAIMTKYGISQSELGVKASKTQQKMLATALKYHQVTLASAAATLYGCRVVMYDRGKGGIMFIGREENIEACEMTMYFLMQQVEALYKQALTPGLTQKARAEYRRTFKDACAIRVSARARRLMEDLMTNNTVSQAATGKNALVVQGHFEKLFAEADAMMEGMNVRKVASKPKKYGSGTEAGRQAGERIKLRQEV